MRPARKGGRPSRRDGSMALIPRPVSMSAQSLRVTQTSSKCVTIAAATVPPASYGTSFQLSDLSNLSAISAMFDQYRIRAINVRFFSPYSKVNTLVTYANAAPASPPALYLTTVIDYDDVTPISQSGTEQYPSHKTVLLSCDEPIAHIVALKPRIAVASYGGAFTSYANQASQWIDIASTGVNHYGVKWTVQPMYADGINPATFGVQVSIYYEVTYDLELRSVR